MDKEPLCEHSTWTNAQSADRKHFTRILMIHCILMKSNLECLLRSLFWSIDMNRFSNTSDVVDQRSFRMEQCEEKSVKSGFLFLNIGEYAETVSYSKFNIFIYLIYWSVNSLRIECFFSSLFFNFDYFIVHALPSSLTNQQQLIFTSYPHFSLCLYARRILRFFHIQH